MGLPDADYVYLAVALRRKAQDTLAKPEERTAAAKFLRKLAREQRDRDIERRKRRSLREIRRRKRQEKILEEMAAERRAWEQEKVRSEERAAERRALNAWLRSEEKERLDNVEWVMSRCPVEHLVVTEFAVLVPDASVLAPGCSWSEPKPSLDILDLVDFVTPHDEYDLKEYELSDSTVIKCASCGCEVMFQCRDKGWQGIQPDPKKPEMHWYCPKTICQKNLRVAMAEAAENWGVDMATGEPQEEEPQGEEEPDPAHAMISGGSKRRPPPGTVIDEY